MWLDWWDQEVEVREKGRFSGMDINRMGGEGAEYNLGDIDEVYVNFQQGWVFP